MSKKKKMKKLRVDLQHVDERVLILKTIESIRQLESDIALHVLTWSYADNGDWQLTDGDTIVGTLKTDAYQGHMFTQTNAVAWRYLCSQTANVMVAIGHRLSEQYVLHP